MPPIGTVLWRSLRAHQIYGANTNVGKTVVSTVLCNALAAEKKGRTGFLKAVSTGPLDEADDRYVAFKTPYRARMLMSDFR
jgi:dethiobiotin synthetase/adenosylmethionine--8-amino-7-oxononanoate aminotransferase